MSYPLWYTVRMMIKEALFKVRIATWSDGTSNWTHIRATDLEHAKRIAWRKWKTLMVLPAETSFRSGEKIVGVFNG